MSPSEDQIEHVSDTALLVAACRAVETELPDGLVDDPFAARLAGARGMAIARAFPRVDVMRFGVGVRVAFLDRLVMETVQTHAIQTVVSAGCGLDSRPWRLDLPRDLHWIEADFPAMIEYKTAVMAAERPRCRLEHLAADLNDPSQRQAVFAAAGNVPALIITEGLLMYLAAESVEAFARESVAMSGIRFWLLDVVSPELNRIMEIGTSRSIENVRAENHLDGVQILDLLRRNGWVPLRHRSYVRDSMEVAAERILAMRAAQAASGAPQIPPPPMDDPSGVYLLGRVQS